MFSSFRLRSFLMAFTSAFLAFLLFWMAVLMLASLIVPYLGL